MIVELFGIRTKNLVTITTIVVTAIVVFGCSAFSQTSDSLMRTESHDGLSMRVSRTGNGFTSSYSYTIESSKDRVAWNYVFDWKQDEPWPLEAIQLKVLDNTFGYFFNQRTLGVSRDGGVTWSITNLDLVLKRNGAVTRPGDGPLEVQVDMDGKIEVFRLDRGTLKTTAPPTLVSSDFGISWVRSN